MLRRKYHIRYSKDSEHEYVVKVIKEGRYPGDTPLGVDVRSHGKTEKMSIYSFTEYNCTDVNKRRRIHKQNSTRVCNNYFC